MDISTDFPEFTLVRLVGGRSNLPHDLIEVKFFIYGDHHMHAIKEARKLIQRNPTDPASQTLSRLVLSLESEADFRIADIYHLDYESFALALKILAEWRLDRYCLGKVRLFDISMQSVELRPESQ
jgi:hypothetical protein